jgi:hypothetical protein
VLSPDDDEGDGRVVTVMKMTVMGKVMLLVVLTVVEKRIMTVDGGIQFQTQMKGENKQKGSYH